MDDALRVVALLPAAVDLVGFRAGIDLTHKFGDPRAEGIVKAHITAENGVGIDFLQIGFRRVKRRLAPHVLEHEASVRTRDFAAFHGVAALYVI